MSYVKYPRTYHLPWSLGVTDDDKVLKSIDHFLGKEVVVTEKMDGECTSIYRDHIHARSIDGRDHPSRSWVKQLWSQIRNDIPEGWRVCGENVYAQHSIRYDKLPSYFLGFSIWDGNNTCLSWDDTMEWFSLLGITHVPFLMCGIFDENLIKTLWDPNMKDIREGYVVRLSGAFPFSEFKQSMGKFVRPHHVQTEDHWMFSDIVKNELDKQII